MTRRKNIVLHLFTELKTLHSSYSFYKRNLQLFESTSFPSIPQSLFCWIFFLILEHIAFVLIHSYFSISCINWVDKVSRPFQALAFCQSKWRRANARNVNQETLNEGQSFDKFKSSCCYTPPPVQHYSFFRNLPPFLHPMLLMLPDYCFVPHHNLLFRN